MAKQTITIRLDEDDLTYLSSVELPGAANLSEKIRALLADARAQREGMHDAALAYDFTRRLFAGAERGIRSAELQAQMRSELVARVTAWLPDAAAIVLSAAELGSGDVRGRTERLRTLERQLGERTIGLLDTLLQMSLAGFPGCYEPEALARRAQPAIRTAARHATPSSPQEEHGS
ncbi:hypothetical protein ACQQ2N_00325 [Dokdonella sp. MW10]|uniref:hypothetical protein n=1 Tax=Dokdonella sp. MW10 TaxID=2992926 RepID=UPI003F81998B